MIGQLLWINGRNGRGMYWLISVLQFALLGWLLSGVFLAAIKDDKNALALGFQNITTFMPILIVSGWLGWMNMIRRYHDRGKSGWWSLLVVAPIIGPIWQFIELGFCRGEDGDNQWGPPPGSGRVRTGHESRGSTGDSGAFAKLDDNYMAEYARKIALQQAEAQELGAASQASFGGGSAAPVFGKR
jgi:uncharacterized membrane protein YhaH (DUF805 family)